MGKSLDVTASLARKILLYLVCYNVRSKFDTVAAIKGRFG